MLYHTTLVVVDSNDNKIQEAASSYPDERNIFISLDVTSDDFYSRLRSVLDEMNLKGFDFIHVSVVLLHIKEPEKTLAALYKLGTVQK